MNAIVPTVLRRFYRKEPISSFIILVGAVDAILGGVNEISSLMILGLLTSGIALGYRWWMLQRAEAEHEYRNKHKQLYLPPQSSRSPLPDLDSSRRPNY